MAKPTMDWETRIGRRLKLRDLHILSTVVRWGSMAKGAAQLGMSQPSVSEAIASLEDTLHVPLLDRSSRGVEPTIYARALLKRGDVVFDELVQGMKDIEFLADPTAGEVRIGCPESLAAGFVPAAIEKMSRHYPKVTVQLIAAQTGEQEFMELRKRSVDLLLGRLFKPLSTDEVVIEPLCRDMLVVAAGARSRWAHRRKISLAELMNEPWISFPANSVSGLYIEEGFRALGLDQPQPSLTSFSMQVRLHLLATGRFLTILHDSVLRFNAKHWSLKALPVDLPLRPVPIAIFTMKNRALSPVARLFTEYVREVAKSLPSVAEREATTTSR